MTCSGPFRGAQSQVKVTSRVPVKVPGPGGPEVWPVRPALASYGVLNPNLNPILSSAIFALQKKSQLTIPESAGALSQTKHSHPPSYSSGPGPVQFLSTLCSDFVQTG